MNWIKQAYMNTADIVERRTRVDNTIYFNFDANTSPDNTRKMSFFSSEGQTVIQIGVAASDAIHGEIYLNGLPAGEFSALDFVLDVWLKERVNTLSITMRGATQGLNVRITGNRLERVLEPLNVVGNTEFGEGCMLYTCEDEKLIRYIVAPSGDVGRERVYGYNALDAKYIYAESGERLRIASAGIDSEGKLLFIDTASIEIAENVKESAVVERRDGGIYILFLQEHTVSLAAVDASGEITYYYGLLNDVESIKSAASGGVFFYKNKQKWQSGEFTRYDNSRLDGCISLDGEIPTMGDNIIKLTTLNAVNRPNAAYERGIVYYIYQSGSVYRKQGRAKDIAAYCEFYIPFKTGGVMVWSKKLCVLLQDATL